MEELKELILEVVVIQLDNFHNLNVVAGAKQVCITPEMPFSDNSIDFLDELSIVLRQSPESKIYPDLMAFSFWCRKENLNIMKRKLNNNHQRLGRGLAFHISPSNVPLNFGYSFIFGLLSGNSNIIKVPSDEFPQAEFFYNTLNDLLKKKKFTSLFDNTAFVKYDKKSDITEYFSSICDVRVIWGGDLTIKNVQEYQTPVRCIDLTFSDRYSLCLINMDKLSALTTTELNKVVKLFYNDIFLMDQNACSSPHIIIWLGAKKKNSKNKFWKLLEKCAKNNYTIESITTMDKYTRLCKTAIEINVPIDFKNYDNYVYRISLKEIPSNIDQFRGNCGFIFEYGISDLDEIRHIINKKYQTMTYFGVDKLLLVEFVIKNKLNGIDRIVPVGKALDIDLIWDGYDIINSMSRIITYN